MPNYKFSEIKEDFMAFMKANKKIDKRAVLKYYREISKTKDFLQIPALSTLYKWYNAR